MTPAPPRLALWIIARRAPARVRDEIVGDVIEDFNGGRPCARAELDPRLAAHLAAHGALRDA